MRPIAGLTYEEHDDGRHELRTSDLTALVDAVGPDLFNAFLRCFIHGDRLTSLVAFMHLSSQTTRGRFAEDRDLYTALLFAFGSIKELGFALGAVRIELNKRRLFDARLWASTVEPFVDWAEGRLPSQIRNAIAFHVDRNVIDRGLAAHKGASAVLLEGMGKKLQSSWCRLGSDCLWNGLEATPEELERALEEARELLIVDPPLKRLFLGTMVRLGLQPLRVTIKGQRPDLS